MVYDKYTLLHIRPFGPFKHCNWSSGALWDWIEKIFAFFPPFVMDKKSGKYDMSAGFTEKAVLIYPTSKLGNVIVTCSPFPTSRSPSHAVSIDAGLKSSVGENKHRKK